MLISDLELKGANGVVTPGEHEARAKEEENDVALGPEDSTGYRSIAARANYLAADHPDLMYAVKELCRGMAAPTKGHWLKLKRLGRYLTTGKATSMRSLVTLTRTGPDVGRPADPLAEEQ